MPATVGRARRRAQQGGQDAHGRGLAGAVGARAGPSTVPSGTARSSPSSARSDAVGLDQTLGADDVGHRVLLSLAVSSHDLWPATDRSERVSRRTLSRATAAERSRRRQTSSMASAMESSTRAGPPREALDVAAPGRAGEHQDRVQPGLDAGDDVGVHPVADHDRVLRVRLDACSARCAASSGSACRRSTARGRWRG